jgi:two-component system phosphate regulon response regulator PhoB
MPGIETNKQILIVDRDVAAIEPLRQRLSEVGFGVRSVTDGKAALHALGDSPPHLIIVDWDMPGCVALELIERLRHPQLTRRARLIIMSALAGEQDIVAGLNLGADDYIAKPYSIREVIARVSAVLRARPPVTGQTALCIDDLTLDPATFRVSARGALISLRRLEFRLLEFLMNHTGRTFSRAQLLASVWGDAKDVDERTVDVNVQRLRRILSKPGYEAYIQTVRGLGYRFAAPASTRTD